MEAITLLRVELGFEEALEGGSVAGGAFVNVDFGAPMVGAATLPWSEQKRNQTAPNARRNFLRPVLVRSAYPLRCPWGV